MKDLNEQGNLNTKGNQFLSVVIATLGGERLQLTIDSLNKGTIVPTEIIIAIPAGFEDGVADIKGANVVILVTKTKGQVSQRCEGFKIARGQFVLQSDDDIILENSCIEHLIKACTSLGVNSACSPSLYFLESGKSVYSKPVSGKLLSSFYYGILNGSKGYREGSITMAGTEIGVDSTKYTDEIIRTEWVPGGITLHHKENLILENFYPHEGKAFTEDLYHSIELRKRGINLFIVIPAIAWIDDPRTAGCPGFFDWYKNISRDYKARKHLVKANNMSLMRMLAFYTTTIAAIFLKRIKNI